MTYEKLSQNERAFLAMTGLTVEEFDSLVEPFEKEVETYLSKWTIDGYKREGRRYTEYKNSSLRGTKPKLLFILSYLKQNPTQEAQGQHFELRQKKVSQWVQVLLPCLVATFKALGALPSRTGVELSERLQSVEREAEEELDRRQEPPSGGAGEGGAQAASPGEGSASEEAGEPGAALRARLAQARAIYLQDGTERPIPRPQDAVDREEYYSGKKKRHTVKNIIIVSKEKRIEYLSDTYEGRNHDKAIADLLDYQLPRGSALGQDLGFLGFEMDGVFIFQPHKKPKNGELTFEQKTENQIISSIRSGVEHAIGGAKRFRIVKDTIRLRFDDAIDLVMAAACSIHNFILDFSNIYYPSLKPE